MGGKLLQAMLLCLSMIGTPSGVGGRGVTILP